MDRPPSTIHPQRRHGTRHGFIVVLILSLALFGAAAHRAGATGVARPPAVANSVCPEQISYGETIECAITALDEVDRYVLTAAAGEHITMRVTRTTGTMRPRITLQNVANEYLCGNLAIVTAEAMCAIPANGSYTIVIDDTFRERTGTYYLHVQRFAAPLGAQSLPIGQSLSGAIDLPAEADAWSFTARAGDRMMVRVSRSGGALEPRLVVYDQAGTYVCGNYESEVAETGCSFGADGSYTLLIDDTFRLNSGQYYVYLQRFNAPGATSAVQASQTVNDVISVPAESDAYAFTAGAGERRLIRVTRTDGTFHPRITVYNAQGGYVCGGYENTVVEVVCVLPTAGTYLLLIDDTHRVQTGRYDMLFSCPEAGCAPICPVQGCGVDPVLDRRMFVPMIVSDG